MSDTGSIYLTLVELQDVHLVHLISGLDEDAPELMPDGATPTAITGYTEWISDVNRVITIGWDWQMLCENSDVQLTRVSPPSSNVVLQSASRQNMHWLTTTKLLEHFIDTFDWQAETLEHINLRYNA